MKRSDHHHHHHHALAVPLLGQGHINPLIRFCRKLASDLGFTITFVNMQVNIDHPPQPLEEAPSIKHDEQELNGGHSLGVEDEDADQEHEQQLDIRYAQIKLEDFHPTTSSIAVLPHFFEAIQSLGPQIEQLLVELQAHGPPVTCVISDLLMTSPTQEIALKFKIPRIVFSTASQNSIVFLNRMLEGTIRIEQVLQVIRNEDQPLEAPKSGDILHFGNDSEYIYKFMLRELQEAKRGGHAIVKNTFEDIEGEALKMDLGLPVYAVGPLVNEASPKSCSFWKEDDSCLCWLDQQPWCSVVYISFGSVARLTLAQFEELVDGLLSSRHRFLWVFRPNLIENSPYSTFPAHLLSRSGGHGFSVSWAPQVSVLSHPSVGAFLSHCGWNSTIEAITTGVPILCWPYFSDQRMNSRFVVEEWKIGLVFQTCPDRGIVPRSEVERVVRTMMDKSEKGKDIRMNSQRLKEAAHKTISPGGTSHGNTEALIRSLG